MLQVVAENSALSFSVGVTIGLLLGIAVVFGFVLFGNDRFGGRLRHHILDD